MIRRLLILHWFLAVFMAGVLVYGLFILVDIGTLSHGGFVAGLAFIGTLMAFLAWPVSLRITKPLERLEASALRIAGGDLSARAEITKEDLIIKQLGTAFDTMAEKVERMIRGGKELTANISHELRSPLTRIRIAGECLKEALDRKDSEDAQEMLRAMWEDIEEADRMIGRILEFSKVDLHEPITMTEVVYPANIVERLAKTLTPSARSKQIEMKLNLDSAVRVAGNEEWLKAAVKNLLENALRYTAEGGLVQVDVKNGDGEVTLEITNSSLPLDQEELEQIFTPFYRGRTANSEGTGLGLAIVQKIVGMHHGAVGARNVPEGFQVWVQLPHTSVKDTE